MSDPVSPGQQTPASTAAHRLSTPESQQCDPGRSVRRYRWRRVRRAFAALTVAIVAAAVAGVIATRRAGDRIDHLLPPTRNAGSKLASMQLYTVAETLQPAVFETPPSTGSAASTGNIVYIEFDRWLSVGAGAGWLHGAMPPPSSPSSLSSGIVGIREQRWFASDGSGRVTARRLPAHDPSTFNEDLIGCGDFATARPSTVDYAAGELRWLLGGLDTPHHSSELLRPLVQRYCAGVSSPRCEQLRTVTVWEADSVDPILIIDAVAEVYRIESPRKPMRALLLSLLAEVDGWHHDNNGPDALGRRGLAVAYTGSDNRTRTLIFDRRTGELRAFHHRLPGELVEYILFTDRSCVETVGRRPDSPPIR